MKVAIIIPAYNEEKRIENTLNSYYNIFSKNKKENIDFTVLVVINNTTDRTEEIVQKISKTKKEIKYLNFKEGGKGFAVKQGFKYALDNNFDLIGFVDADMASPPEVFLGLIRNIGNLDGIISNRYDKRSIVNPKQPFMRILASRVFNLITRSLFLFNFRDTQCGAKLFKRKAIEAIIPELSMSQWAVDIDILYNIKKKGFKVKEIPTLWRDDAAGSKINLRKSSMQMFFAVVQLRMLNSPLKRGWMLIKPISGRLYHRIR